MAVLSEIVPAIMKIPASASSSQSTLGFFRDGDRRYWQGQSEVFVVVTYGKSKLRRRRFQRALTKKQQTNRDNGHFFPAQNCLIFEGSSSDMRHLGSKRAGIRSHLRKVRVVTAGGNARASSQTLSDPGNLTGGISCIRMYEESKTPNEANRSIPSQTHLNKTKGYFPTGKSLNANERMQPEKCFSHLTLSGSFLFTRAVVTFNATDSKLSVSLSLQRPRMEKLTQREVISGFHLWKI